MSRRISPARPDPEAAAREKAMFRRWLDLPHWEKFAFSERVNALARRGADLPAVRAALMDEIEAVEQACRIAGVLTLWQDLQAPEVTGEARANGIELAQFDLGEAARLSAF